MNDSTTAINARGGEAVSERQFKAVVEGRANVVAYRNIEDRILLGVMEHMGVKGRRNGIGTVGLDTEQARALGEYLIALADDIGEPNR